MEIRYNMINILLASWIFIKQKTVTFGLYPLETYFCQPPHIAVCTEVWYSARLSMG